MQLDGTGAKGKKGGAAEGKKKGGKKEAKETSSLQIGEPQSEPGSLRELRRLGSLQNIPFPIIGANTDKAV